MIKKNFSAIDAYVDCRKQKIKTELEQRSGAIIILELIVSPQEISRDLWKEN